MLICRRPPVVQKNRGVDDKPMRWKILYWWGLLATIVFKDEINRLVQQLMNVLFMRAFGVWIVPMRNWNEYKDCDHHIFQVVWIVPMRNWNLPTPRATVPAATPRLDRTYEELKPNCWESAITPATGLDRTYEELKLPTAFLCATYLRGLDRTYEELKHRTRPKPLHVFRRLDRTYEELKLGMVCGKNDWGGVWIVPMRNWNNHLPDSSIITTECLDRTYEELKRGMYDPGFVPSFRLDRTYEELKHETEDEYFTYLETVWIVPMRNWNQRRRLPYEWLRDCRLDRTYEELKLVCDCWLCGGDHVCLDRTYEELKHLFTLHRHANLDLSLDRTYEELKRSIKVVDVGPDYAVWIVPMRNWNFLARRPQCLLWTQFGSYLWGIETTSGNSSLKSDSRGLDRTYEELKHDFVV